MPEAISRLAESLKDRYRIDRELGAGGMATVYLADDLRHQRKVAVKVLRPELAAAIGADRFLREITTTANLRHPNILPLFDSGEGAGFLYYVMPFIEGETLRDRLRRDQRLPVEDALRIADEVADALAYAHSRGVIHRDIKPENVLIDAGHAVVADFGIAYAVQGSADGRLTLTGMSLGTPHYMSPEQSTSDEIDGRSDLYALACMLYELLTGAPPFTGANPAVIMKGHLMDPVPSLATTLPSLDKAVVAAVERALAKSPADRFASVGEWRDVLRGSMTRSTTSAASAVIDKPPPAPPTALLGRDAQLDDAVAAVTGGARILTVTGYGGTGKTRFAIELYHRLRGGFAGGAAFVSLASVTAAAEVMPVIGTTLDIAEALGRSALDAVATVIADRSVLLVLDNLEQVVDAAGDLATLVSRCPGLAVVATSRRPLKVGAEVEFALPPLALPPDDTSETDELLRCPSVALFVQRAAKVKPGFALSPANAVSVAAICRKLDGLPLALELAAARVRIMEPAALLQRLDHALDLLTSGDRDLPLRQRTLRATISWSYSLLTPGEQCALRRLSVFHEGWTFEAMERVCYAEHEAFQALDELESLVEKGLVRVIGDGERYSLLETIRAFGAEQLHAGGEVAAVRDAHAAYFLELSESIADGIVGTEQLSAMARGRVDHANLLAALGWLVEQARRGDAGAVERGMALVGNLCMYFHIIGAHLYAKEVVDTLLPMARDWPPSRGRALARFMGGMIAVSTGDPAKSVEEWSAMGEDGRAMGDAVLTCWGVGASGFSLVGMGEVEQAAPRLAEALQLARQVGNAFLEALWLTVDGMRQFLAGDLEGGRASVESARPIQERIGDFEGGGLSLSFLASMTFAAGDLPEAMRLYHRALDEFRTVGDIPEVARVYCEAGYVALASGNVPEALRLFQDAVRTNDGIGSPAGTGQALIGLAAAEAAAGNTQRAVTIAAAARVLSEKAGVVIVHPMATGVAERIEELRATIPEAELEALVSSGASLTPQAVLSMVAA